MARMGPPSKYKEEYCDKVIEFMAKGYSIEAFAGLVGVHRATVYEWIKKYPDFAEAKGIADAKSGLYWEGQLIECGRTGKGNGTLIMYGLQNRSEGAWQDIRTVKHTGANGGPVETKDVSARDKLFDLVSRVSERGREDEDKNTTH